MRFLLLYVLLLFFAFVSSFVALFVSLVSSSLWVVDWPSSWPLAVIDVPVHTTRKMFDRRGVEKCEVNLSDRCGIGAPSNRKLPTWAPTSYLRSSGRSCTTEHASSCTSRTVADRFWSRSWSKYALPRTISGMARCKCVVKAPRACKPRSTHHSVAFQIAPNSSCCLHVLQKVIIT